MYRTKLKQTPEDRIRKLSRKYEDAKIKYGDAKFTKFSLRKVAKVLEHGQFIPKDQLTDVRNIMKHYTQIFREHFMSYKKEEWKDKIKMPPVISLDGQYIKHMYGNYEDTNNALFGKKTAKPTIPRSKSRLISQKRRSKSRKNSRK